MPLKCRALDTTAHLRTQYPTKDPLTRQCIISFHPLKWFIISTKPRVISWDKICFQPGQRVSDPAPVSNQPPATKSKSLQNRAQKKFLSYHIANELANLNSPLHYSYKNTLKCGQTITQAGKELTSTYCGNRWCLVCNGIRTAKSITKHLPILESFTDPQFVTLSVINVAIDVRELKQINRRMSEATRKIQDLLRKKRYGITLKGIRKFEAIPAKNGVQINAHLHWIIEGDILDETAIVRVWKNQKLPGAMLMHLVRQKEAGKITIGRITGEMLVQLWMKQFPEGVARRSGQDVRPADKNSLMELFKYTTKLLTKTKGRFVIPLRTIDVIFQAVRSRRTINLTGFTKDELKKYKAALEVETEKIECDLQAQQYDDLHETDDIWEWRGDNWYNYITGQPLVKYSPDKYEADFIEAIDYG